MLSMSVRVTGLASLPGGPELRGAIRQALRRSGELIKLKAEANLSGRLVGMRTGKLRRGMKLDLRRQGFVVAIRNTVFYAHMLEGGTKPHTIPGPLTRRERRAGVRQKVLRFQAGGKVIFAWSVMHPGLRPRRWFASALHDAIPQLEAIFERELGVVIENRGVIVA